MATHAVFCEAVEASETASVGVAVFEPRIGASARVISPRSDSQVQLQHDLGFEGRTSFATYHGALRLGERDRVEFEAFKFDQSSSVITSRTRKIGSIDFLVSFDLDTRVAIAGAGATWARTLISSGGHEFGGRLGFHLVSLDVSVSSVDLEQSRNGRGLAVYPHAGLFVRRVAATGWAWSARADLSEIKVKRFDGRALSLAAGLEHRFANGFAVGAEYRYWDARFAATRNSTKREFSGRFSGPAAYLMLAF